MYEMNCIDCKYQNSKFKLQYEGEYLSEEKKIIDNEVCPKDKPIKIKNEGCFLTYCLPKEFEDKNCIISNSIIKSQWMNNIQRFGEGNLIKISLDYGNNGELFLLAQKRRK